MMDRGAQTASSHRTRNGLIIAFAVLGGIIIPIALYPFLSYTHPLPRNYADARLNRFVERVAPYLWPSAPIAPTGGTRGEFLMFWAISLGINALIYSAGIYLIYYILYLISKVIRFVGDRDDEG